MNTVLSCKCIGCGTSIARMYTLLSGAKIAQFKGDSVTTITLPSIATASIR